MSLTEEVLALWQNGFSSYEIAEILHMPHDRVLETVRKARKREARKAKEEKGRHGDFFVRAGSGAGYWWNNRFNFGRSSGGK